MTMAFGKLVVVESSSFMHMISRSVMIVVLVIVVVHSPCFKEKRGFRFQFTFHSRNQNNSTLSI